LNWPPNSDKGSPLLKTSIGFTELILVLGSQPAGDRSHRPGGSLPLLSRPIITSPAAGEKVGGLKFGALANAPWLCSFNTTDAELTVLLGMFLCCSFYRYPEIVLDPIAYHNPYIYAMVSFSAGSSLHVFPVVLRLYIGECCGM